MLAFADPIKQIVKTMFPHVNDEHLYGPSELRNTIIKGAKDEEGNPLTIRQALLDIGTKVGRGYNDSIWLDNMGFRIDEAAKDNKPIVMITDCRFRNEFDWLKEQNFNMIKIKRDSKIQINHVSETAQDSLLDEEFDFIIDNNGSYPDLRRIMCRQIIPNLKK